MGLRGRWKQREGMDRKFRSCDVWRNSTLLQANCRLRHRGMDKSEGGEEVEEEGEKGKE